MDVKRQQVGVDQGDLLDEALKATLCHGVSGEGGAGPETCGVSQAPTVWDQERALTRHLMEVVTGSANLNRAYKRVKANGGAPGVDGMTVDDLRGWIAVNREALIASLLDGSYKPHPPAFAGAGSAGCIDPQTGRRGAPTRHPHGRGSFGTAIDRAGSGPDPRPNVLGVEFWVQAWARRARRAASGTGVCGGRI